MPQTSIERFSFSIIDKQNLSIKFPNDIPTKLYLTRCLQYQAAPPQADWQGIAYLETK